jgi:hypothetical protein
MYKIVHKTALILITALVCSTGCAASIETKGMPVLTVLAAQGSA